MKRLDHYWYTRNALTLLLAPLSWLFCALVRLRRLAYRRGLKGSERLDRPVVVIGNITVGGSGKTPLVIAAARLLTEAGFRPGIVSRGYGGQAQTWPQRVGEESEPRQVGDEPVLIAARTGRPVYVGPDRVAAARALLQAHPEVDIVLADDGLQHYRLRRDVEVAVVDGARGFGNGRCLPAGPLREPVGRLREVDLTVVNGDRSGVPGYEMRLVQQPLVNLHEPAKRLPLNAFRGHAVHAVAAIGNPERFFGALREADIDIVPHGFADHYPFEAADLDFGDDLPILMTEKDAVKCRPFAHGRMWYLPVAAKLPNAFEQRLLQCVRGNGNG